MTLELIVSFLVLKAALVALFMAIYQNADVFKTKSIWKIMVAKASK